MPTGEIDDRESAKPEDGVALGNDGDAFVVWTAMRERRGRALKGPRSRWSDCRVAKHATENSTHEKSVERARENETDPDAGAMRAPQAETQRHWQGTYRTARVSQRKRNCFSPILLPRPSAALPRAATDDLCGVIARGVAPALHPAPSQGERDDRRFIASPSTATMCRHGRTVGRAVARVHSACKRCPRLHPHAQPMRVRDGFARSHAHYS